MVVYCGWSQIVGFYLMVELLQGELATNGATPSCFLIGHSQNVSVGHDAQIRSGLQLINKLGF